MYLCTRFLITKTRFIMKQLSSYSAHSNSSRTHVIPARTHSYAPYITMLVVCLTMSINSLWGAIVVYDFSSSDGLTALGIVEPAKSSGTQLNPASTYTLSPIDMQITHGGSTNTRIWKSSSDELSFNIYYSAEKQGTITFSSARTMTKIILGSNNFTANTGTFSSGTWTGSATSVTFTTTANNTGIKNIIIDYEQSGYTNKFVRISSASELSDGDEVIFVNSAETYACGTSQSTNYRTPVSITTESHAYSYSTDDNVQIFYVRKEGDIYGFHTGYGYLYSNNNTSTNYQLRTNSATISTDPSGTSAWTLSAESSVFTIQNVDHDARRMQFNGTRYFSAYASQSNPLIYKRQIGLPDYFIDIMHGNEVATQYGTYDMPNLDNTVEGSYEEAAHYIFIGWVAAGDYSTTDGSITGTIIAPGTEMTGNNTTYYAVWGKDVE